MKVAVSIPDVVYEQGERLALRLKLPRSRLYARALAAYAAQHDDNAITAAANALADDEDYQAEARIITRAGARTVLKHTEW